MKDTDPEFWKELTMKTTHSVSLPDEDTMTPEDESLLATELEDEDLDDSEIPTKTVIKLVIDKKVPEGITVRQSGSLMSNRAAESLDVVDENAGESGPGSSAATSTVEQLGLGKRKRKANTLYREFWRHNDDSDSDIEPGTGGEELEAMCVSMFLSDS
jgi:hypothetical protein